MGKKKQIKLKPQKIKYDLYSLNWELVDKILKKTSS